MYGRFLKEKSSSIAVVFRRARRQEFSHYSFSEKFTSRGNKHSTSVPSRLGRDSSDFGPRRTLTACRFYSSGSGEGKHVSVRDDASDSVHGKVLCGEVKRDAGNGDEHARLGEQDQKEWLCNENLSFEVEDNESPFLTKQGRFRNEFLKRVTLWEEIPISWESFPYYVSEHTKNLLVECAASHLKHKTFASRYGGRLTSSSGRILLEGIPGTELYRERMVKALSRDLQVPLLVVDSSIFAPLSQDAESDEDEESMESGEECTSCSEPEDDASNDVDNDKAQTDESDEDNVDIRTSREALKKLVPHIFEELGVKISGQSEPESSSVTSQEDAINSTQQSGRLFRKGDRVKYVGAPVCIEGDKRSLSTGQRGEVYKTVGNKVAVMLDNADVDKNDAKTSIYWIDIQDIAHDLDIEAQDWYIAINSLCEVVSFLRNVIVYFVDSEEISRATKRSNYKVFLQRLEEMFNQLTGSHVFIFGKNKQGTWSKEKDRFMALPQVAHLGRMTIPLSQLTERFKSNKMSKRDGLYEVFANVISVDPPKEDEVLKKFHNQLEQDRRIILSRKNLVELHRVLDDHELSCSELSLLASDDFVLTRQKAEQVIGWARNNYLSSCVSPSIRNGRLALPRQSLEIAISRLREQERILNKPSQNLKSIIKDDYEKNFISSVVPSEEIGVKFDDIGALEDVKTTLNELVTLPMRRPELFSHGNLLRPCKGILLFGPPGTGKTLLAKALATESGANFMSITGSTLTSKWFGDAEKLTKALFSFASRLAPVIVFVDEIDSLLGARGGALEHEATRRMRNEFMAAWDGLRSKDSQRILVLGATNRPFDLDDAVIRRLPRRIYVDLPDAKNRTKIVRILLAQERLEESFRYDKLANETEGYSGSDLKNLCIAAAYRPVQELLDDEKKEGGIKSESALRALTLDDFIHAKSKVGASVAYDASSMNELRKWNEQYGEGGSRRRSPFGFGD